MIIRRLATAIQNQDWFTVFVEFLLIIVGLLVALQIDNWNQLRKDRLDEEYYLNRIIGDIDESIAANEKDIDFAAHEFDVYLLPRMRKTSNSCAAKSWEP